MKIEFEVGKKYKNALFGMELIYTCRFIGSTKVFLETDDGGGVAIPFLRGGYEAGWREYKEPVVHKRTLVWYKSRFGDEINIATNFTSKQLEKWGYEVLRVEEISYTEGE